MNKLSDIVNQRLSVCFGFEWNRAGGINEASTCERVPGRETVIIYNHDRRSHPSRRPLLPWKEDDDDALCRSLWADEFHIVSWKNNTGLC